VVAWRSSLLGVAFSGALFASGPAQAGNKTAAEALFRDGTRLLQAGHVDEACPKLAESQAIDPALGTLLYLAACHEKQGLTASAWSEFSSATEWAQRANQPERVQFGRRHLAALEARLSGVLIHASRVPGLELRIDDGLLSGAALGTRLPLDPGDHTIEASAPGYQTWRTRITIASGQTTAAVTVPRLVVASVPVTPAARIAAAPSVPVTPVAPIAATSPTDSPEPSQDATIPETATDSAGAGAAVAPGPSNPHILMWTAVGVAGAGIVVGSTFGALTLGARDSARSKCPNNRCMPGGLDDISRARTDASVSTVGFAVGIAAAAAAGYLLIRGDGASATPAATAGRITILPSVSAHEASVSLLGRFQ
jgi:hypothetical protein